MQYNRTSISVRVRLILSAGGNQMKSPLVVFFSMALLATMTSRGESCPVDPALSSCLFPDHLPAAPETVAIRVATIGDCRPIDMAFVEVQIVLETGYLDQDQQQTASGVTDLAGKVEVVFPEGISGEGTFRFEVLGNDIELCSSEVYTVSVTSTVPVIQATWGRIKAKYGN